MVNWANTALVFPGQGSQMVGMGKDVAEAYPVSRELFEQADELLGLDFSTLCFDGPEDDLNDTINTQPALYVCSLAILRALQSELSDMAPACVAGHSLGELTALAAAGAMSFEDGLSLVRERGRLMKEAGEKNPGAMAALLGLDADAVREVCKQAESQTGGTLVLANDNCPGQVVISGDDLTIIAGMQLAQDAGAKRAVKLAVSIAAHSPLMESASTVFQLHLSQTTFTAPQYPVYANVTAEPLTDADAIRKELNNQLTQSVRWTESVQAMIGAGVDYFVEIGSKDVLTGLLRRIDRSKRGVALNGLDALQKFVSEA